MRCLESIKQKAGNNSYEIILMDDNSTDETRNAENHLENVNIQRNSNNLGFLLNCNKGASMAKGKYLVFLNNDTIVLPGWLDSLVETFDTVPSTGLVGSKLIFSNGLLQEAGGIVFKDGSAMNYGREDNPKLPQYNYLKDVDYCSGASICVRRDLWNKIGGFDTQYSPAYYEDTDLAFQIRSLGYRTIYQPNSEVLHFEGLSHGTDLNSGVKKKQAENQIIFHKKWKMELEKNHYSRNYKIKLARERNFKAKFLLVILSKVPAKKEAIFDTINTIYKDSNGVMKFLILEETYDFDDSTNCYWQQKGVEILQIKNESAFWKSWLDENNDAITDIYFEGKKSETLWNKYTEHLEQVNFKKQLLKE
jgi:GT2 family glycosyltransferase